MKVRVSVVANKGKGDFVVKRHGRVYVLNKTDPKRKQRQAGPIKKRRRVAAKLHKITSVV